MSSGVGPSRRPGALRHLWDGLVSSLWFVPSILVVAGMATAIALIALDMHVDLPSRIDGTVVGVGADGARGVLTAIATSVVTVAGVAFSITIVTLSLASSQYSSRVLRNFMNDPTNQWVLGLLVATFAYCVVVLQTIHGGSEQSFVPTIALFGGVVLAFVAIGAFVYFIHHVASSIQASSIVARVAAETIASARALFPELGVDGVEEDEGTADVGPRHWRLVPALAGGYVQRVDVEALVAFAETHAMVVRTEREVGAFVAAGRPLVALDGARPAGRDEVGALNACFVLGAARTTFQDPAFGIRQLVDVALKALSPGVNDTTTAVLCVDWIGAILCELGRRGFPQLVRCAAERARVVLCGPTYESLVALAFDEIRQSAGGNATVLGRQLEVLEELIDEASRPRRRACLRRHAERIGATARRTILLHADRAPLEAARARIRSGEAPVRPALR